MDLSATEEQSDRLSSKEAGPGSKSFHQMGTPQDAMNDTKKKKKYVYWGADLKMREKDRKDVLARVGFVEVDRNLLPFYPPAPHDIADAIAEFAPERFAFASWLAVVLCLVINVVALTVYRIRGGALTLFFKPTLYVLMAVPGSCFRSLLVDIFRRRRESTFKFGWFFLLYTLHIGICFAAAICPPISFVRESFNLRESLVSIDVFIAFFLMKYASRNEGGSMKRLVLWDFLVRLTCFLTMVWWGKLYPGCNTVVWFNLFINMGLT